MRQRCRNLNINCEQLDVPLQDGDLPGHVQGGARPGDAEDEDAGLLGA